MAQIETKDILKNIFEVSTDGIVCFDLKGNILFANNSFLEMIVYNKQEITGKNINQIIKGEKIFNKIFVENEAAENFFELTFINKSGETFNLHAKYWRQHIGLEEVTTWLIVKNPKDTFNKEISINVQDAVTNLKEQNKIIIKCLKNLNQDLGGNIEDVDDYIGFASKSSGRINEILDELSASFCSEIRIKKTKAELIDTNRITKKKRL